MRNTFIMLVVISAATALPGQTYLSKEYVHLGGRILAVENNINLGLTLATNVTQSNPWYVVASADINRDGVPDLVWQQNPSSGWIQVWFMGGADGTTILGAANIATTPLKVVAAADFNGDGTPDLVLQDSSGLVTVWYLYVSGTSPNYTITYNPVSVTTSPNSWHVVGAADFNQDGHPDLVWQNPTNGAIQIWYMNGVTLSSAATVAASSSLTVVATQDFNADDVPDLVLQNPSTGLLQVWFMASSTSGTVLNRG
jgi:hypothetical protein